MFPECLCMCGCVNLEQTLLARYLGYLLKEFDQTSPLTGFWARMNAPNFGVKRLRFKVTVGSNMPQNSLFGLVVVTCKRRHNWGYLPTD